MKADEIGTILYECDIDEPSGKVSFNEWHIRTVRAGKVYAIHKNSLTWGKRSTKIGDYGWLDPIWPPCRRSKQINEQWSRWMGMTTTKKAAIKLAIQSMQNAEEEWYEGITIAEIVKKLKTLYKRV